jgi:uncharacterized NAD(P)/FAD-binding protein YdhS
MKHVVIIGGGFSGCLTAVNLSRFSNGPLQITILNQGFPLGRGIAYSTRNGSHLLNVAARNMSALADKPTHFVEWLRTRAEYRDEPVEKLRERFVPRRIYGDYIHGLLFSRSVAGTARDITIESVAAEAVDVTPAAEGAAVILSNGESIGADRVVLATGNQQPSNLNIKGLDTAHPQYFQNPWLGWEEKLGDPTQNVILIGTGLTMIDAFLSLKDAGWKGKIFAVSRNGLLPLSHFKGVEYGDWIGENREPQSLAQIYRIFKRHFRNLDAEGVNPAILVDKLRPVTQQIWKNFSLREKRRFNRHFRTRWNVTRHRIAQSIHEELSEAIAKERLEIVKGRLSNVDANGKRLVLTVKAGGEYRKIEGGALINCTGPSESFSNTTSPLYQNLLSRGLVQADEMDMGIRATGDFAVVEQSGEASQFMLALGPMLKGTLWETSAVPELRSQAFKLAEIMVKQLSEQTLSNIKEDVHAVLEYQI